MKKVIKLTEKDLTNLIKRVISEQGGDEEALLPAAQQDADPEIECTVMAFIGGGGVSAEVEYVLYMDGDHYGVRFIIDGGGNVTIKHGEEIGFGDLKNKALTAKIFNHFSKNFHYDQTAGKIGSGFLFFGNLKMDGSIDTNATFDYNEPLN